MTSDDTKASALNRREFIRRASAALGLGAPYIRAQRTDNTLVVNSFGGEYQELSKKTLSSPREEVRRQGGA